LSFLKKKLTPPKASISLELAKWRFSPGETLEGKLVINSEEDFDADGIRCEIECVEEIKSRVSEYDSASKRMVERDVWNRIIHFAEKPTVCGPIQIARGSTHAFPISIKLPTSAWLTYRGGDRKLTWSIKGVIAVKGRPDATSKTVEIEVGEPQQIQPPPPPPMPAPQVAATPTMSQTPAATPTPQPPPSLPLPTNCSRCGAPLSVSHEDLVVTCRYCGFTMTVATREEVKRHSMLENRLFAQQAVEAAKRYMDKGVFRVGVSKEAIITDVKLRYVPFWVCQVTTNTYFRGVTGTGIMGEIHQAQEAVTDKRSSGLAKFGKLVLAGVKAYAETQQKDRRPQTVAYSFSNTYIWPTLARRTMISEINYYDVPAARKIPFDVGKIPQDAEFLNIELNEEEAKAKIKAEVEAKERLIACGKVDTLETCNTNVVMGEMELVHAPVWFVHYTLGGENYVVAVDGCEGKVLGGGRPLFKIK
jgi:DNA-directed RNA polymerase subunit RPC12/RpoP